MNRWTAITSILLIALIFTGVALLEQVVISDHYRMAESELKKALQEQRQHNERNMITVIMNQMPAFGMSNGFVTIFGERGGQWWSWIPTSTNTINFSPAEINLGAVRPFKPEL